MGRLGAMAGRSRSHIFTALGAVIACGGRDAEVFQYFDHGDIEPAAVWAERMARGEPDPFGIEDLYPDVIPCLAALRSAGLFVGVAGNQLQQRQAILEGFGLPVDLIATSGTWGVEKPTPAFFRNVIDACALPPQEIVYVGDRLDNDVLPALAAGMVAVLLRRGLWGYIHARLPDARRAQLRIDSLSQLPALLCRWNEAVRA